MSSPVSSPGVGERTVAPDRLSRWQVINVALLIAGYSGYYLCRSNLSVAMPLLIAEMGQRGVSRPQRG